MSKDALLTALAPLLQGLPDLKTLSAADAKAALEQRFPASSLASLKALVRRGVVEGGLCDKSAQAAGGPVRFSRVLKAADPSAWSVDVVNMGCIAAGHTHPTGEFDLCFVVDGDPRFDGNPEGWTVYAAGTWHEPTVVGGTMDILYFLPGGQIRFEPAPS